MLSYIYNSTLGRRRGCIAGVEVVIGEKGQDRNETDVLFVVVSNFFMLDGGLQWKRQEIVIIT